MLEYIYKEYLIPERMQHGLDVYTKHHTKPGKFLTAIFENDFVKACNSADKENIKNLPAYANYLYNHAPSACWGSAEIVKKWLK